MAPTASRPPRTCCAAPRAKSAVLPTSSSYTTSSAAAFPLSSARCPQASALCPSPLDRTASLSASSQRWGAWTQLFTQRLWTLGYQEEALASILDALPADFCRAIRAASTQVRGTVRAAAAAAPALAPPGADMAEPAFLECLEGIWEMDGEEAFIEFAFDPATEQGTSVTLNSATASLAGTHKQKVPPTPT